MPAKTMLLNQLKMEVNDHLNSLITAPDSASLGVLMPIAGQSPTNAVQLSANLDSDLLNAWIAASDTDVLVIQRHGTIVHESYADGANNGLSINTMSMTKNIIALLIGIAIDEGHITSEDSQIKRYIPELQIDDRHSVTVGALLNHRSGLKSGLRELRQTLQGEALSHTQLASLEFSKEQAFRYDNINYHLLSQILTRAYEELLSTIIEEKLWRPLGLAPAKIVDSAGYCCLFATARSWLVLGQLYLDRGMHNGSPVVAKEWIVKMLSKPETANEFFVQTTGFSRVTDTDTTSIAG
ncbi:MAG: serine hydrolase [Porticoccaceae bacterium]|nr:serine hydrolase [Porticoccaceae bacterium]